MSYTVIQVENLSKQYRLGKVGTGTLTHDLNRWWHKVRGKDDPYLKVGEDNDRTTKGHSEYVWSLRDINFEVNQGEVLGIIGSNGAGKSTLLKILSKTTAPTVGSVRLKGRVSSLLEVGTGFHPELSGKENIFLNGSILGMKRNEIQSKYDEIVQFSGVERYIDTPVKRYSSGMYVRLAFAVAAHLEPDVLIVDEVLAVGDTEFQQKCLGKMSSVAREGRTILFVSHNHQAIKKLCTSAVLLKQGKLTMMGNTSEVLQHYLSSNNDLLLSEWKLDKSNEHLQVQNDYFMLTRILILDESGQPINKPLSVEAKYIYIILEGVVNKINDKLCIGFVLRDDYYNYLIVHNHTDSYPEDKIQLKKGVNRIKTKIDISVLNEGNYYVDFNSSLWGIKMLHSADEVKISAKFSIKGLRGDPLFYTKRRESILSPYLKWDNIA